MSAIISEIQLMRGMGIFADRDGNSPSLELRRYNLIYGFNGSGKSTLSRLFSSLQHGTLDDRLPGACSFELELTDQTRFGYPKNSNGLEQRLFVFNEDFIEKNLRWTAGLANPVFYIGANQADAAARLANIEHKIFEKQLKKITADTGAKGAENAFAIFKRERAKATASHLYLAGRKYEAPNLANDYESWKESNLITLSDTKLNALVDIRRRDVPLHSLTNIAFDISRIAKAFQDTIEICGQSITNVSLNELRQYPEMLIWLKHGHEFHKENARDDCLFCGNHISNERSDRLASEFDSHIDDFIDRLNKTADELKALIAEIFRLPTIIPSADALVAEMRESYRENRSEFLSGSQKIHAFLSNLEKILNKKQKHPATPSDLSVLAEMANRDNTISSMAIAMDAINSAILEHNTIVKDFSNEKTKAEVAIRKHFVAECLETYEKHLDEVDKAKLKCNDLAKEISTLSEEAERLRRQIRAHAPAATAINELVASYLGHNELTIHPISQGYELHRYGNPIKGPPSEGEKMAIAISYFLSSLEAEGRKLKNLIVVVDDPVSSLDTKALNYACALIKKRLRDAAQVFVMTHNLQCMNEFKKAWKQFHPSKNKSNPTATFLFIDVCVPAGQKTRSSNIIEMSKLLREYESEYHFLFSHVLRFVNNAQDCFDHGYIMPNVLRRVLDVFLTFKYPGSEGFVGKIDAIARFYPGFDTDRLSALERLSQTESHSDNHDDLLSFSSMTVEESRQAATTLLDLIEHVDPVHLKRIREVCKP